MSAIDFEKFVLKETGDEVEIGTSGEARGAALSMVRQSGRTLEIMSRDLDFPIFDDVEFAEVVRELALKSPRAQVRMLVRDTQPIVARGHRLVDLAKRLTSFVEIRVPAEEHARYNSAFLIADGRGVVYRRLADRFDGIVNFNDPRLARNLADQFEEMWRVARPDPAIRDLHI
jgi:hypothetical protein